MHARRILTTHAAAPTISANPSVRWVALADLPPSPLWGDFELTTSRSSTREPPMDLERTDYIAPSHLALEHLLLMETQERRVRLQRLVFGQKQLCLGPDQ